MGDLGGRPGRGLGTFLTATHHPPKAWLVEKTGALRGREGNSHYLSSQTSISTFCMPPVAFLCLAMHIALPAWAASCSGKKEALFMPLSISQEIAQKSLGRHNNNLGGREKTLM